MKKAEISIEVMIYAALALVLLAVLVAVLFVTTSEKTEQISDISDKLTCVGQGGKCIPSEECTGEELDFFCGIDKICCKQPLIT